MLASLFSSLRRLTAAAAVLMFAHLYFLQQRVAAAPTASLAAQSVAMSAQNMASGFGADAAAAADGALAARQGLQGAAAMAAVPEEARGSFIRYQLALALSGSQQPRSWAFEPEARIAIDTIVSGREMAAFKSVPVYDDFSSDLLHWVRQSFDSSEADISRLLRNETTLLCTAQGICYTLADIGCSCCPF